MGVTIVGISADPVAKSAALVAKLGINFSVLSDPELSAATAYGVVQQGRDIAVPGVFIVDASGQIAWRYIGDREDRPSLERLVVEVKRVR